MARWAAGKRKRAQEHATTAAAGDGAATDAGGGPAAAAPARQARPAGARRSARIHGVAPDSGDNNHSGHDECTARHSGNQAATTAAAAGTSDGRNQAQQPNRRRKRDARSADHVGDDDIDGEARQRLPPAQRGVGGSRGGKRSGGTSNRGGLGEDPGSDAACGDVADAAATVDLEQDAADIVPHTVVNGAAAAAAAAAVVGPGPASPQAQLPHAADGQQRMPACFQKLLWCQRIVERNLIPASADAAAYIASIWKLSKTNKRVVLPVRMHIEGQGPMPECGEAIGKATMEYLSTLDGQVHVLRVRDVPAELLGKYFNTM